MKKHLSVLMLIAGSTIYKVLGLLAFMAAAEGALFTLTLRGSLTAYEAGLGMTAIETVFLRSRVSLVFAVCFLLLMVLLCTTGCEYGSRQGYTLRRLSVPEQSVFLWQALFNSFCLLLLWAAQLAVALALCRLYAVRAPSGLVSGQTVFLAFYRSSFLHSLIPLSEVSRWARNIFLVLSLGAASANFSYRQRRGKIGAGAIAMASITLVFFSRDIGSMSSDIGILLLTAVHTEETVRGVLRRRPDEEA